MKGRMYKNGNFLVQKDCLDSARENSLLYELSNTIDFDFNVKAEPYSLGNSEVAYSVYNSRTHKMYVVTGADCARYAEGYAVRLYAHTPDAGEVDEIMDAGA